MKKVWIILTTVMLVLMLTLLSMPITAVSAEPNQPIECVVDIEFNPPIDPLDPRCWHGTVSGCSIAGEIEFCELPAELVGRNKFFFETFTINPSVGGEIRGVDEGVWNFSTFKFRANGYVTETSPEWEDMVGFKFHEMGTTSNPADGFPVTAYNTKMTLHQP